MNDLQSILQSDPRYLEERRRELQLYLDMFSKQLLQVISVMPAPAIKINLLTGEYERITDPKWQALIDKILKQQEDSLRLSFPEFYS